MSQLFISLGSNRGSRIFNCVMAINRFARLCMGKVVKISPFYLTEPVDMPPQPWFVNCAAELLVELSPREILRLSQQVEAELGRTSKGDLSPRTVDMDILFYGQRVVSTPFLHIPHPRLHQRAFVLKPLCDIAPDYPHPLTARTVEEMRGMLGEQGEGGRIITISTPVNMVVNPRPEKFSAISNPVLRW